MRIAAALALLAAACGPADPPARPTNGAAAPPPGEPDNRIECRVAGAARLRARLHGRASAEPGRPGADHPQGRWRLPPAAGRPRRARRRRRRRRRAGRMSPARATAGIEVAIGGDRFRLPATSAAMTGRFILTAAEMRAAEEAAIAAGTPVEELMERAGKAAAEAIWRYRRAAADAGPVRARQQWRRRLCHRPRARARAASPSGSPLWPSPKSDGGRAPRGQLGRGRSKRWRRRRRRRC